MRFHWGKFQLQARARMRFICAGVLGASLIGAGFLMSPSELSWFLQPSPLMMLLGPLIGLTIFAYPSEVVLDSFRIILDMEMPTRKNCEKASEFFDSLGNMGLATGILGAILQLTHVVTHLKAGSILENAMAIGIALFAVAFGVGLKLMFAIPLKQMVHRKLSAVEALTDPNKSST